MFDSLLKVGLGLIIETPASLIADLVTMGGALTDQEVPYTYDALSKVIKNIKESTE